MVTAVKQGQWPLFNAAADLIGNARRILRPGGPPRALKTV